MERSTLRKLLKQMSESELKHKLDPDRGLRNLAEESLEKNNKKTMHIEFNRDLDLINEKNTKFLKQPISNSLQLQMAISQHTRYSKFPIHTHDYVEINYVYAGQCKQIINGEHLTLHEGDVCILDTHVPHTFLETTEDDIIINFIMLQSFFNTAFLSRLSGTGIISDFLVNAISQTQDHNRYIVFQTKNESRIKDTVENLLCEYFDPTICSKEIIESYLVIFFSELLRAFQKRQVKGEDKSSSTLLVDILKYLENNYKDCTLISTAGHFNFHPNYLSAYLRKATGRTFKELVQIQRMTLAGIFLINSTLTVYEIAQEVGYNNLGFFYKKFTSYFGETPSDYRERFKNL